MQVLKVTMHRKAKRTDSQILVIIEGKGKLICADLDEWMKYYHNTRTHQGKVCCGRTPMETLLDGKKVWAEKNLAHI